MANDKKNREQEETLSQEEIQALKALNSTIADKENEGDRDWFMKHTAPEFAFQRADGKTFDDRLTFVMKVTPIKEKPEARKTSKVKVIRTPHNKKRAIVSCIVTQKGVAYHNLRLFVRPAEDKEWVLLGWANEPV